MWNFAYVLPKLNSNEPTMLVIPSSLQMGWAEIPPFFCATTKSACNIAQDLFKQDPKLLAMHPLEQHTLPAGWTMPNQVKCCTPFVNLIELHVDNFCSLIQSNDKEVLLGTS